MKKVAYKPLSNSDESIISNDEGIESAQPLKTIVLLKLIDNSKLIKASSNGDLNTVKALLEKRSIFKI